MLILNALSVRCTAILHYVKEKPEFCCFYVISSLYVLQDYA